MPKKKKDQSSENKSDSEKVPEVPVPGFVLGTTVAELVISKDGLRTFAMYRKGAISHTSKHRAPHFYHVPPDDTLAGSVVHFARESARYCQPHDLLQQIKAYIHRYLELPPSYEAISASCSKTGRGTRDIEGGDVHDIGDRPFSYGVYRLDRELIVRTIGQTADHDTQC